ncbi:MAG: hypothetical protein ABSG17_24320 [Spirochaetia bacterium]|jgi:hypothetical protein
MCIDYNALSAWGTIVAAVVALGLGVYPVWKERLEKRAMARNIRQQLLALLTSMGIKYRVSLSTVARSLLVTNKEPNQLSELRALYPHATLLTPKERSLVAAVYLVMSVAHNFDRIEAGALVDLEKAVREAENGLRAD